MSNEKAVLKAIYGSDKTPLKLGEAEVPCYVLEDGTRVLSGRAIQKAIGYEGSSGDWLKKFVTTKSIANAIDPKIIAGLSEPISFQRVDAGGSQPITYGYEATTLIDLCDAILDLKKAGVLKESQLIYAEQAEIIIRSVAKVGIIALVDEATGYLQDKNRAKDEFQKFLKQFMRDDAAKLVKRFEDSFFEMIYRMRGWTWKYAHKHPGVVGVWINDLVYERLAPLVLNELRKKNPVDGKGRKNKHHQFLTDQVGVPRLLNHLAAVEALGRASGYNWNRFMEMVDMAFPKQYQQLNLLFDEPAPKTVENNQDLSDFNKDLKKALDYNPKDTASK